MTFFFASARPSPVSNALVAGVPLIAANDNGNGLSGDVLLHKALRHFAEHGLSAARVAGENARAALGEGDSEGCRYWLAICGTLDRRMASATATRLGLAAEA